MKHSVITNFQVGKNGINVGVTESLTLALKYHRQIRISVLKSSGRDKRNIEEMALELQQKLPVKCDFRIIGFTIILTKNGKYRKIIQKKVMF